MGIIIPTDSYFFRGVAQPPDRITINSKIDHEFTGVQSERIALLPIHLSAERAPSGKARLVFQKASVETQGWLVIFTFLLVKASL